MIEPASPEDIPRLTALLGDLFAMERDFRIDPERQSRGLRMILDAPDRGTVLVGRDRSGSVAGMVSIQLLVSTAAGGISGQIEDLVVGKEERFRGLGSKLLAEAISWGRLRGAVRFHLAAELGNDAARTFYIHRGFRESRMGLLYRCEEDEGGG
jgi:GNAT superfamily N-acetyltransferase